MIDVAANLERVHERVARACAEAGRDPAEITVVAVSKRIPLTRVAEACRAGQCVLGENRIQDAIPRQAELAGLLGAAPPPRWHFIGTLQSNKARRAVGAFDLIHGVNSLELGHRLDRIAGESGITQPILLQVNATGEASKHGLDPDAAKGVAEALAEAPHLDLQGLMTMGRAGDAGAELGRTFATLRRLVEDLRRSTFRPLPHLSMGMSGDFETAIVEGATLIRVGSAIFGPRD